MSISKGEFEASPNLVRENPRSRGQPGMHRAELTCGDVVGSAHGHH